MASRWFANRGQIIQTVAAILGASLSAAAFVITLNRSYPNIRMGGYFSENLLLVYLLLAVFALTSFLVIRSVAGLILALAHVDERVAKAGQAITPVLTSAATEKDETREQKKSVVIQYDIHRRVGDYWSHLRNGVEDIRVTVVNVRKNESIADGEGEFGAELLVTAGSTRVSGGDQTELISPGRYFVPVAQKHMSRPSLSLYFYIAFPQLSHFFAVSVTHVDPHSGLVTLLACFVEGMT